MSGDTLRVSYVSIAHDFPVSVPVSPPRAGPEPVCHNLPNAQIAMVIPEFSKLLNFPATGV